MLALLLAVLTPAATAAAEPVTRPEVRAEIHRMASEDQHVREELIAQLHAGKTPDFKPMHAVDSANQPRVEAILTTYGWPTPKLVGKQGVNEFWLLVQHAAPALQLRCMPLAEHAWQAGELQGQDYALLYDRVQLGLGHQQRYGTQFGARNPGDPQALLPLEDPAHVDERRKAVGLMPLAEYERMIHEMYDPPARKLDPTRPRP